MTSSPFRRWGLLAAAMAAAGGELVMVAAVAAVVELVVALVAVAAVAATAALMVRMKCRAPLRF